MQLVGSPNKAWEGFGMTFNPIQSKMTTEKILKHLCPDSNSVKNLMSGNLSDRMNFLASKISDQIKVTILLFVSLSQLNLNNLDDIH